MGEGVGYDGLESGVDECEMVYCNVVEKDGKNKDEIGRCVKRWWWWIIM